MREAYVKKSSGLLFLRVCANQLTVCTLKLRDGAYQRERFNLTAFKSSNECEKVYNSYIGSGVQITKDELKHPVMI